MPVAKPPNIVFCPSSLPARFPLDALSNMGGLAILPCVPEIGVGEGVKESRKIIVETREIGKDHGGKKKEDVAQSGVDLLGVVTHPHPSLPSLRRACVIVCPFRTYT